MDIGRDYTELWHHQAQIRDAVQAPLLSGEKWMAPLLQLGVRALGRSLASLDRPEGTTVALTVHGEGGGSWAARVEEGAWEVMEGRPEAPSAEVELAADVAWRLLFNAVSGREARREASASGDEELLDAVFATRSVMV